MVAAAVADLETEAATEVGTAGDARHRLQPRWAETNKPPRSDEVDLSILEVTPLNLNRRAVEAWTIITGEDRRAMDPARVLVTTVGHGAAVAVHAEITRHHATRALLRAEAKTPPTESSRVDLLDEVKMLPTEASRVDGSALLVIEKDPVEEIGMNPEAGQAVVASELATLLL